MSAVRIAAHVVGGPPRTLAEKPPARELKESFERGEGAIYRFEDYN